MSFLKLAGMLLAGLCLGGTAAAESLPVLELSAGIHRVEAEVAATQATRMTGLMQRRAMPQQRGMLFVFDESRQHCMWMKNTYIPLSVAFLDDAGTIVNIEDMQPHTEDAHCAKRPVRFALEMNKGWFAQRGIKPGAKLRGLDKLAPR